MGVYDYLEGACPTCGENIAEQIKWFVDVPNFEDCFRTFISDDSAQIMMDEITRTNEFFEIFVNDNQRTFVQKIIDAIKRAKRFFQRSSNDKLYKLLQELKDSSTFPAPIEDGEYATHEWPYCACKSEKMLFAVVLGNKFMRFTRDPEGEVQDLNYERHAIEGVIDSFRELERNLLKPHYPDYSDMPDYPDIPDDE